MYELILLFKRESDNQKAYQVESGQKGKKRRRVHNTIDEKLHDYDLAYMTCEMELHT